jgi:hypothetical protein
MTARRPPIVIVGAPRSGTNMLRDCLVKLDGFTTWPCDEINYIWRHGNIDHPTDELAPELATAAVQRYVRRAFDRIGAKHPDARVVEKTCANCLRLPFVNAIVPDATYIEITRNPVDAAASAIQRWSAPLDVRYLARKARFVPLRDLPIYAFQYLGHRITKLRRSDGRLGSWGPKFTGLRDMLESGSSVAEISAAQWLACTTAADQFLTTLPPHRVHRLVYEDFVRDPADGMRELVRFLDVPATDDDIARAVADVTSTSIGRSASQLSDADRAGIDSVLAAGRK